MKGAMTVKTNTIKAEDPPPLWSGHEKEYKSVKRKHKAPKVEIFHSFKLTDVREKD